MTTDYAALIATAREAQAQLRDAIEGEDAQVSYSTLLALRGITESHTALIDALSESAAELEKLRALRSHEPIPRGDGTYGWMCGHHSFQPRETP